MRPDRIAKLMSALPDLCGRSLPERERGRETDGGSSETSPVDALRAALAETGLKAAIDDCQCPAGFDAEAFAALQRLARTLDAPDDSGGAGAWLDGAQMDEVRQAAGTALALLEGRYWTAADPPPPSREAVAARLEALIRGDTSREELSGWATRWVVMDRPNVEDQRVWSALLALGGADMPSTDRKYLYHEADFRNWLDELCDR